MFRRLLGWLRYADRGPVVEQHAPPEAGVHAQAHAELEARIAEVDAQVDEAWHYGEMALVDRLLDMRNAIRPPRPAPRRARPSVPVVPGRST